MLEYISENKDWIFSGIGISIFGIIIFIVRYIIKNKDNNGSQEVNGVANCYRIIPNIILRKLFPASRISSLVLMDIRSRGDSVRLNLGELPECQIWLQITNHSPFKIDFESIRGVLNYNGCSINIDDVDHFDINPHSTGNSFYLKGDLTGEQANHCSKETDKPYVSLALNSRMRTRFIVFKKCLSDLQYFNVYIINKR